MYSKTVNALEDAMRMRAARESVHRLYKSIDPTKLLVILLHFIDPEVVKPLLIDLRNGLVDKTDDQLDSLIGAIENNFLA